MKNRLIIAVFTICSLSLFAQNKAVFTVQADKPTTDVSPNMWGIFFEDINMGADGGLYAELIKNRSFEFFKPLMGWTVKGDKTQWGQNIDGAITIITRPEKAETNPRFMRVNLENHKKGTLGLVNEGFKGMGIKKDLHYDFSVLYRLPKTTNAKMHLELVTEKGDVIASGVFEPSKKDNIWHKGEVSFTATATEPKAKLNIWFEGNGVLDLDMISLFPSDTWKGRKGGLRNDMVQILADLKPGFVRFPGGCIVEGHDLSLRYQWKKTVGPVEDRKLIVNRWNYEFAHRPAPDYFQSFGLGFFEYFQMAEDIGAEPLPILSCGLACQFNSDEMAPIESLDTYVQDALDLVEFANGAVTTKWGKVRANMGHPAPFNLKLIGVGNENWGPQYVERAKIFQARIKKLYPNIKLVFSAGPAPNGEMFEFLDPKLRTMKADLIDEHYYSSPEWFLKNANRYDNYDRKSASKIFAGEYAGHDKEQKNSWRAAISEAAFMTGLERNADIVRMASYAPLFGHVDGWQWKPNLIWVDNLRTMPTPNYQVQKMYSNNKGSQVVPILYKNASAIGQDSLYASAVLDKKTNELVIKIVNTSKDAQTAEINVEGAKKLDNKARLTILQNDNLEAENTLDNPSVVAPTQAEIETKNNVISLNLKGYSFMMVRVKY